MMIRINKVLRTHKRLLTLPAVLLAALALAATHATMTGGSQEHGSHHGGDSSGAVTTVMILCLAIIETGVAVGLALAAIALRRRNPTRMFWSLAAPAARPARIANGPPPPSLAQLQSFLR